jgi:mono/diheme cytochrome c family protein
MKKLILSAVIITAMVLTFNRCYYDNYQELHPNVGGGGCDTTNVTYTANVSKIFTDYCVSCHGGTFPTGGFLLDNYNSAHDYCLANKQNVLDAINQTGNVTPMPQGSPKIDACSIKMITKWINSGAPQ